MIADEDENIVVVIEVFENPRKKAVHPLQYIDSCFHLLKMTGFVGEEILEKCKVERFSDFIESFSGLVRTEYRQSVPETVQPFVREIGREGIACHDIFDGI